MLQPKLANDILDTKMAHVKSTQSSIIVTANPGCLLQMKAGIKRAGLEGEMEAVHIVDFLVESMDRAQSQA
jgi:glycolate oxidase iron-sulfur subunit